jgi:hypothetical protein
LVLNDKGVNAASRITEEFFADMAKNDYRSAAQLFYYPTGNSATADEETLVMTRRLATLQAQFGPIKSFIGSRRVMPYVEVGISAATVDYWARHPKGLRLTFDVRFASSYGDGFIIMELCQTQETRWRIRGLHYGLPAVDPRSLARVAAAASRL